MKGTTSTAHEPRSSSSCAACKLLKRRCAPTCIFAPYFRSDHPSQFAKLHKVFGASNVSKILHEVPLHRREDTVNSLTYEAEARLLDPVYGCLGPIALLHRRMAQLHHDLAVARARLAKYAEAAQGAETSAPMTWGWAGDELMAVCGGGRVGECHGDGGGGGGGYGEHFGGPPSFLM